MLEVKITEDGTVEYFRVSGNVTELSASVAMAIGILHDELKNPIVKAVFRDNIIRIVNAKNSPVWTFNPGKKSVKDGEPSVEIRFPFFEEGLT